MADTIRVLVAEDDGLLRRALVELIQLDSAFEVVGQVPNGQLAVDEAERVNPDVVLTDIDMPKLNGIDATRMIREKNSAIVVVILTKFGDDENLFRAIRAGATGYVLKDASIDEIKQAMREAREGEGHLNPALVARVLHEFARVSEAAKARKAVFAELTRREMEVLELLGKGQKNRAIADTLCLSEKTVKAHVGAVLRKLQVNDRTEAALLAQRHGIGDV